MFTFYHKLLNIYSFIGQGKNKDIIENAIAELARKTCVRLVPKDSPLAQGLGHSSYIEFFSGRYQYDRIVQFKWPSGFQ